MSHKFILITALVLPSVARACAVCMGGQASTQRDAVNAALLSMLGVMALVFGLLTFFVVRMVRLSRVSMAPDSPTAPMPPMEILER